MTKETGLTSFDILGRVTGHKQTTDGQQYTTGYSYNLAGALIEETYPSGRVVKNVLDHSGDLSIVESRKNASSGFWHYADAFTYNAAGAVKSGWGQCCDSAIFDPFIWVSRRPNVAQIKIA